MKIEFEEGKTYYLEDGRVVLTEDYHRNRGFCCGAKCRHCPFEPLHEKGGKILKQTKDNKE
jgi:hypothetical protein|tara:strand:+ start:159 stop:341 length:183 start_codon:yes stop_codon:yes gene_type:complete